MRVYREPMSAREQLRVTPKWPEFVILRERNLWHAVTNAGRPKMPYFWMNLGASHPDLPDDLLISMGREGLDAAYAKAHPNGCPKIGH